jgi:hypothetical protein
MQVLQCPNCKKAMGFKRDIGWGTFFGAIVTLGIWLFTIPFYPKRCIGCGLEAAKVNLNPLEINSLARKAGGFKWWMIPLGLVAFIIIFNLVILFSKK